MTTTATTPQTRLTVVQMTHVENAIVRAREALRHLTEIAKVGTATPARLLAAEHQLRAAANIVPSID